MRAMLRAIKSKIRIWLVIKLLRIMGWEKGGSGKKKWSSRETSWWGPKIKLNLNKMEQDKWKFWMKNLVVQVNYRLICLEILVQLTWKIFHPLERVIRHLYPKIHFLENQTNLVKIAINPIKFQSNSQLMRSKKTLCRMLKTINQLYFRLKAPWFLKMSTKLQSRIGFTI